MHALLLLTLVLTAGIAVFLLIIPGGSHLALAVCALIGTGVLSALGLLHRGKPRLATSLYLLTVWAGLTYLALHVPGSLGSPILAVFSLLVIAAGLFAGLRSGIVLGWLSLASLAGLTYVTAYPALRVHAPAAALAPISNLLFHLLNLGLALALVFVIARNRQQANQRVRRQRDKLLRKNCELEQVRAALEVRIAERMAEISRQKQFYEALVENNPLAIVTLDRSHKVISVNPAFERLFGYARSEVTGQPLDDFVATPETYAEAARYTEQVQHGEAVHATGRRRRKDGSEVEVEIYGMPVVVHGVQVGVLGLYSDITERKQTEANLQHLATHDPLTDLPNRALFYKRLDQALTHASHVGTSVVVMFLDLDGFKSVNDAFGHEKGDQLLQDMGLRFRDCLRDGDMVARLSGDEFTFVIEHIRRKEDAAAVASRVLQALTEPFYIEGHPLTVTASIGISMSPCDGKDAATLLKNADAAMYQAKERGKNNFQFYAEPSLVSEEPAA